MGKPIKSRGRSNGTGRVGTGKKIKQVPSSKKRSSSGKAKKKRIAKPVERDTVASLTKMARKLGSDRNVMVRK